MFLFLFSMILNSKANELEFIYQWDTKPKIVICPDSKVKKEDVEAALEFWKTQGFNFKTKGIYYSDHCDLEYHTIQISDYASNEEPRIRGELGATNVTWISWDSGETKTLETVDVNIPVDSANRHDVIFHEIGHAFGLAHNDNNFIMTPKL